MIDWRKYAKAFTGGAAGAVLGGIAVVAGGALEWRAIVVGAAAGFVAVAGPVFGIPNRS